MSGRARVEPRALRVLHLPFNIASQISTTVRALREVGVDAVGLVYGSAAVQSPEGVQLFAPEPGIARFATQARWARAVVREIVRADVVHWHYAAPGLPGAADLRLARRLGKPGLVEFWGSDVRIPAIEGLDNPYFARMGGAYEYQEAETREGSFARQRRFAALGVRDAMGLPCFEPFLAPGAFERFHHSMGRVTLADFEPRFPSPDERRPLVVHAPTAPVAKGTATVLAAVEALKGRFDFDFQLIHGLPRARALELVQTCDVLVDQLNAGHYGLAAIEAMAMGKPVVTYVKPAAARAYPDSLPIVNATHDDLTEVLGALLADPQRRHDVGRRSRAYAEAHHDAHVHAGRLRSLYEAMVAGRR